MRLHAITLAILGMIFSAVATTDAENAASCQKHAGNDYTAAISAFCSRANLVVPSEYSYEGLVHGNAKVRIYGNCYPTQWIPSYWCAAQFHAMCASAGSRTSDGVSRSLLE
ncbi:hypothetical protein BDV97DRAFT_425526 [Delphinella strobiligena]|nr:hypothetical protein BDV97DRAFT_425526 [Delphinella strobiligena]